MCRNATLDPFDFKTWSSATDLVMYDEDGFRMSPFKRTGCECLPGFNVGPSELAVYYPVRENELAPGGSNALGGGGGGVGGGGLPFPMQGNGGAGGGGGGGGQSFKQPHQTISGGNPISLEPYRPGELSPDGGLSNLGGNPRGGRLSLDSRCLLDHDVVEFHASFKAPANFEPSWVEIVNTKPLELEYPLGESGGASYQPAANTANTAAHHDDDGGTKQDSTMATNTTPAVDRGAGGDHNDAGRGGGGRVGVNYCKTSSECLLKTPDYMRTDIAEFHKSVVIIARCDFVLAPLSLEAYQECVRYRYWVAQKLRNHFVDWREIMIQHLRETFDLMEGDIRLRVNKCKASIKRLSTIPKAFTESLERPKAIAATTPTLLGAATTAAAATTPTTTTTVTTTTASNNNNNNNNKDNDETKYYAKVLINPNKEFNYWADNQQEQQQHHRRVKELQQQARFSSEPTIAEYNHLDQYALIDADVDCELTIHSAISDDPVPPTHLAWLYSRKLEKQLPKFIVKSNERFGPDYYLMAPNVLIQRESFDNLAKHRKAFSPCKSSYAYCDSQTDCEMVDTVNFSCTCKYGFTPIGSRHIYPGDSRKEVCEDIDECLFDVCKENGLENKSTCYNEIGDYRCQCDSHHVGDNKRHCTHICTILACKYGDCRIFDKFAYCECHEGYRDSDCSVQDPSVALRKANMIIIGSIFTSILLLAIALAISLNSQLKRTKKKLKRIEVAYEAAQLMDLPHQQPFRPRLSKVSG